MQSVIDVRLIALSNYFKLALKSNNTLQVHPVYSSTFIKIYEYYVRLRKSFIYLTINS